MVRENGPKKAESRFSIPLKGPLLGTLESPEVMLVPMGRWGVVAAPKQIRTLLGSWRG